MFRTLGLSGGVVAFDYGAHTVRMGGLIDEPEGNMIVHTIQQRYSIASAIRDLKEHG